MQQLIDVWTALDSRRRILVGLATIAMFAAVLGLSRMATSKNMTLLYAGLESGPAGEVVTALEQRGVVFDVRGGAIYVDSARRDELRMTLASAGLPANSSQGYELLDSLNGFGTTSQMFDAAYWRAKEGELARTILSGPQITSARVHIAQATGNPFQRNVRPSASVAVTTSANGVSPQQARALKYLVSSAVPGMGAEDVAIIDGNGGLVGGEEDATTGTTSEDRAAELRDRVQRLVEARVGYGNAVVEVSVDTVTETESITERRVDPASRVAISIDNEETTTTSQDAAGGDVTVASNLPDGDAAGGGSSSSQNSETRERINYEVSETTREVVRAAGAIKRLTVAVLVNGTLETAADGTQSFAPLPVEELASLEALVASAVGFEEARGDMITIRSMAFEERTLAGTPAITPSFMDRLALDPIYMAQMAVLALVALLLGLFVVRPILSGSARIESNAAVPQLPVPVSGSQTTPPPLTGEIDDGTQDFGNVPAVRGPTDTASDLALRSEQDPAERLRALIGERQEETVQILRNWLDPNEEKA